MKAVTIISGCQLLGVLPLAAALNPQSSAPEGCKTLHTDKEWPAHSVWKASLPNVLSRGLAKDKLRHPDYRIEPATTAEVQAAVKFATKHNIRVSILNSGHDFLGRLVKAIAMRRRLSGIGTTRPAD
jgi:FAD binding domain